MDPAPVDQSTVHHRRGPIDSPERRNDSLHGCVEIRFPGESCVRASARRPVHPDVIRPVDEDVGYRRVCEQWLGGPRPRTRSAMILAHSAAKWWAIESRRSASALTSDRRNGTGPIAMSPMTRSITPGISQTLSQARTQRAEPPTSRQQASNQRPAEAREHGAWTARPSSSRHGLPDGRAVLDGSEKTRKQRPDRDLGARPHAGRASNHQCAPTLGQRCRSWATPDGLDGTGRQGATPDRPGLSSDADGPSAARSERVRPLASARSPHMSMTRALPATWARPKAESNDSTGSGM